MKLEFEITKLNSEGNNKTYEVKRKGLVIGMLWLDGEHYSKIKEINKMVIE